MPDARGEIAPGRPARLDGEAATALDAALRVSPADGGLWTAPKVAACIQARTGESVNHSTAWRVMRRMGFTLQVPRPRHRRAASSEEQAAFKSRISRGMEDVPNFDIEGIFGKLANDDYDQAVQLAVSFQGEASRANAIIAVVRSVLNEKSVSVKQSKSAL